jgi:hypothetical protein
MNLVILPDSNQTERTWASRLDEKFGGMFENSCLQYYDHWFGGSDFATIDCESELGKLSSYVENFGKYVIVGKGAGALLAVRGIAEGVVTPEVCVFLNMNLPNEEWLMHYDTPTLFVQNGINIDAKIKELEGYLNDLNVSRCEVIGIECEDNGDEEIDKIVDLTKRFIDL